MVLLLVAGFYLGWNIGANDSANCAGTSIGSRLIPHRSAMLWVGVFAIVGAWVGGGAVVETVGTGIVTEALPWKVIFIAMVSAGICVTLATWFRIPVSTSQAIVGGMTGIGWIAGADVDLSKVITIVEVWVSSPILAAIFSFLLFHLLAYPLRAIRRIGTFDRVLHWLVVLSIGYAAFSLGANNVGNAVGPLANMGIRSPGVALLGGVAMAVGALTYGHRVTGTVAHGVVPLDPLSAFTVQISLALVTHIFAIVGVPISLSQAVIGALIGIGIIKGERVLHRKRILSIILGWVVTPIAAGSLACVVYLVSSGIRS